MIILNEWYLVNKYILHTLVGMNDINNWILYELPFYFYILFTVGHQTFIIISNIYVAMTLLLFYGRGIKLVLFLTLLPLIFFSLLHFPDFAYHSILFLKIWLAIFKSTYTKFFTPRFEKKNYEYRDCFFPPFKNWMGCQNKWRKIVRHSY